MKCLEKWLWKKVKNEKLVSSKDIINECQNEFGFICKTEMRSANENKHAKVLTASSCYWYVHECIQNIERKTVKANNNESQGQNLY